MSSSALSWAFRLALPPTGKLVMLALADRADEHGNCNPSVADIVSRTGLRESVVQRTFAGMAADGLIRDRIGIRSDGSQWSSGFVLQLDEAGRVGFTPPLAPEARSGPRFVVSGPAVRAARSRKTQEAVR